MTAAPTGNNGVEAAGGGAAVAVAPTKVPASVNICMEAMTATKATTATEMATTATKTATGHPPLDPPPPPLSIGIWTEWKRGWENGLRRGGGNDRDVKQVYPKMFAKEKETLKPRMAEINKAAVGNKENTPPSLTPV